MSPRSSYTVAVSSEPIIETQADLVEAINAITPESRVEAVLVTSDRPVREARLVEATGLKAAEVHEAIESLNEAYAVSDRVFRITAVADGWQMLTQASVAPGACAATGGSSTVTTLAARDGNLVNYCVPTTCSSRRD